MPYLVHTQARMMGKTHSAARVDRQRSEARSARPWRRMREMVLKRDLYTCQVTRNGKPCGYVGPDCEVDHIKPDHMGGLTELSNLQTICKQCHALKTAGEAGQVGNASMIPAWMPRISVPGKLMVVCGRPGSARAEYVKGRLRPGDEIVCLDRMAAEANTKLWDLKREERHALIRLRNQRIAEFAKSQPTNFSMYIITVAGNPMHRHYWEERGADVVVVDDPLEVCQRRITGMGLPPAVTAEWMQAAEDWK